MMHESKASIYRFKTMHKWNVYVPVFLEILEIALRQFACQFRICVRNF